MRVLVFFVILIAVNSSVKGQLPPGTIQLMPDQLVKKELPGEMHLTAAYAEILEGDPKQEGFFTQRIYLPPGTVLKPHSHPRDERVTVLSGCLYVAFGDSLDWTKGHTFYGGCFYVNPAKQNHYVWTLDGAYIQITGMGPWELNFVDKK